MFCLFTADVFENRITFSYINGYIRVNENREMVSQKLNMLLLVFNNKYITIAKRVP